MWLLGKHVKSYNRGCALILYLIWPSHQILRNGRHYPGNMFTIKASAAPWSASHCHALLNNHCISNLCPESTDLPMPRGKCCIPCTKTPFDPSMAAFSVPLTAVACHGILNPVEHRDIPQGFHRVCRSLRSSLGAAHLLENTEGPVWSTTFHPLPLRVQANRSFRPTV